MFRRPRSERDSAVEEELTALGEQIDELEESGIDLSLEDPLPLPEVPAPLVDLERLQQCVTEDLGLSLGAPGRPVTRSPARASRDESGWAALLTYGHPELDAALQAAATNGVSDAVVVFSAALTA